MAWLEDAIGGNLLAASGLLAGAMLLKRVAPQLGPGARSLAINGLKLFAEAEFEMQDGIIGKLANEAVKHLLSTMPSGDPGEPGHPAQQIAKDFERLARARSSRPAWNARDRRARYRHHVRKFKAALAHASRSLPAAQQEYLRHAGAEIAEDW